MKEAIVTILLLALVSSSWARIEDDVWLVAPEDYSDGSTGAVDAAVRRSLEALRARMPEGIPEYDIPVLDPLSIPRHDISIGSGFTSLEISVEDVKVRGLSSFSLEGVKTDLQNLAADLNISFPHLEVSGQYAVQGKAAGALEVFGNGSFTLLLGGLWTGSMVRLSAKEHSLQIASLILDLSLKSMKAGFENLMGGGAAGDLVNHLLGDHGPELVQQHRAELGAYVAGEIRSEINPLLERFSLEQLLEALGVHPHT